VFTESLPSNEHLLWLDYSGFQATCNDISKILFVYFLTGKIKCNMPKSVITPGEMEVMKIKAGGVALCLYYEKFIF
jgi:hypothetical protein